MLGQYVEIRVKDTGPGIPHTEKEKIFDRFYQLNNDDSRKNEGSGIGLALTKELVELHKGKVSVESELGTGPSGKVGGSTFIISLPISKVFFEENEIIESAEVQKTDIPANLYQNQTEKIDSHELEGSSKGINNDRSVVLIVEDNSDLRAYISASVSQFYQVEESENGMLGFEKAIEIIPDLIISDIMMPEMDGTELCKKLKNDERTSHIPLILLTAKAGLDNKLEGLETGADDYLIKPFDVSELQVRVKNLIFQRKKLREKFSKEFFVNGNQPKITSADDRFIIKAIGIINEHISEADFSIETFGNLLGVSHNQLYRKLHAITNETPSRFVRKHRLKRSLQMLEKSHDNISQIAYLVGFNNASYYTKCFRELFGVSPGDYIKKE